MVCELANIFGQHAFIDGMKVEIEMWRGVLKNTGVK